MNPGSRKVWIFIRQLGQNKLLKNVTAVQLAVAYKRWHATLPGWVPLSVTRFRNMFLFIRLIDRISRKFPHNLCLENITA
jgi:hypothetical protein